MDGMSFLHYANSLNTDDCVVWPLCKNAKGYGRMRRGKAHRVAYELFVGPIPDGMLVMHSCDNPSCVNPRHLKVGTPRDNTKDMHDKWRHKNGSKVLSKNDVGVLLVLRSAGLTQTEIARNLGTSQAVVSAHLTKRGQHGRIN